MNLLVFGIPNWFTSSGILMELVFALVTIMISVYSYKVYKITKQRNTFLFGGAFFSIALAYFLQATLNFLITTKVNSKDLFSLVMPVTHCPSFQLSVLAVFSHMFFMIIGLSLLSYVTLKERNHQTFVLLVLLSLTAIALSHYLLLSFFIISSIFLLFITLQHYKRHVKKGKRSTLILFMGFGLIFLGMLQLAISTYLGLFYLLGHISMFIGYFLLLINFWRVLK